MSEVLLLLQGALRGVGHQLRILCFNAVGFWGVGVSSGALLTFVAHWGLRGIWTGITLGVTVACVLNLLGLSAVDWKGSAEQTSGGEAGSMHPAPLQGGTQVKHDSPVSGSNHTSWLAALWASVTGRGAAVPSRENYSLVDDMHDNKAHEMKVLVADLDL